MVLIRGGPYACEMKRTDELCLTWDRTVVTADMVVVVGADVVRDENCESRDLLGGGDGLSCVVVVFHSTLRRQ